MPSLPQIPSPFVSISSYFPLKAYPPINPPYKKSITEPTLWILPPRLKDPPDNVLSSDVECLKWQTYMALRGLSKVKIRYDIKPAGSLDGSLPNLHVPIEQSLLASEKMSKSDGASDGQLLPARSIPAWVDARLGVDSTADPLEGYLDQAARVESRAWVSLLEGIIHAALILHQPPPSYLETILFPSTKPPLTEDLQKILCPPPASLTGLCSFLPPTGTRFSLSTILSRYRDAISSLSQRLGTDRWFLGSNEPTPLDALAFAYLHCILHSDNAIRIEVTRRVNLVAWEWRVRCLVRERFSQ